jgi:hypothetical protein
MSEKINEETQEQLEKLEEIEEPEEKAEAEGSSVMEDILKKLHESSLQSAITKKYLATGRKMLSDEIPRKLDATTLSQMQKFFQAPLGEVRIHTGEKAAAAAEALGARAFALGDEDIFFGKGEYAPETKEGRAVIAHELTHVVEKKTALAPAAINPTLQASEASARQTAGRVLAQEDGSPAGGGGGGTADDGAGAKSEEGEGDNKKIFGMKPKLFMDEFWKFFQKMERLEKSRRGL